MTKSEHSYHIYIFLFSEYDDIIYQIPDFYIIFCIFFSLFYSFATKGVSIEINQSKLEYSGPN